MVVSSTYCPVLSLVGVAAQPPVSPPIASAPVNPSRKTNVDAERDVFMKGAGLLAERFLGFADLFLCVALELFGIAFGLQMVASNYLADAFLDLAGNILGGTFDFVFGARFHAKRSLVFHKADSLGLRPAMLNGVKPEHH
jgi:hypothetical protein